MKKDKTTVLAIGRWMPIHLGHKGFLTRLAREYDRLIVGIGSCYENGTPRNCIPAVEREKLLRRIFKKEGITNVEIVPVQDRPTFEEWFGDISRLCEIYGVTHFCTGNKEDILSVMSEKGLVLNAEMINPEETSDFPYHATDIRCAILDNEFDRLDSMIPSEIKDIVLDQVAKEIKMAAEGTGQEFIPGRQTVDLVFVADDEENKKKYLLIGKRNDGKVDFPGYYAIPGGGICEFESPVDAAIRCFKAETGIELSVKDNSCEPAIVVLDNLGAEEEKMYFIGIYASPDERINGTRGGGSQCFAVVRKGSVDEIKTVLHSEHDMTELLFVELDSIYKIDFAYDQKRMVYNALNRLGIACDKGELLQVFDENGEPASKSVSRLRAHRDGTLHGASHTYIYKWEDDSLYILLQRRSLDKDSYPGCLDTSSAGHVEFGSDFAETACKELYEELGLQVDFSLFEELFEQRIDQKSVFHGKEFIDREINKIYALNMPCDISELKFQPEEVSEAIWVGADAILEGVSGDSPELCVDKNEITKVINLLKEIHD